MLFRSENPKQLEKNHVVPTSSQDEALARDGLSREVPCSALKGETVPDSYNQTRDNYFDIFCVDSKGCSMML